MKKVIPIKVVPYRALPCEASEFTIKGMVADKDDFGYNTDCGSFDYEYGDYADENWACADNQFVRIDCTPEVLEKYNITEQEFLVIQDELADEFSIGCCGWCV